MAILLKNLKVHVLYYDRVAEVNVLVTNKYGGKANMRATGLIYNYQSGRHEIIDLHDNQLETIKKERS